MPPAQQSVWWDCRAVAHAGAQRKRTASRQKDAASFFPGAIGRWSESRMRRTTNFTLARGAAARTRLFFSGHTMGGRGFDDFRDDFGEPEDHRVLVRKLAPSDADRPFGFGRTQVMEADAGDMHAESGVGNQR